MNTYILIPHYNRWDLTHARLFELYRHCREQITEVIVIDDCSVDNMTEGGLRWWKENFSSKGFLVSSVVTPENLNFLGACNFGLQKVLGKAQDGDLITLLSNDVRIMTDFVSQMTDIIGQRGNKLLLGGILYSHDTGWNRFGDRIFPYLEGWLLGATAETWKVLGCGFDDRYSLSDFEDVDLSTTAVDMGYELVPLNNPGLHHMGGQSIQYGDERMTRTKKNRIKFSEKWIDSR